MTRYKEMAQLQERLEKLSYEIEQAEKKFHLRGHRPGGTHMGHLVKVRTDHDRLAKQLKQADESLWESMSQTWHEDMEGLLDSFSKAIMYEDEEYRLGEG